VRFEPDVNFNSDGDPPANTTDEPTLTFHAWDGASGAEGDSVDLSGAGATGGTTAFSTGSGTASVAVTSVIDALFSDATDTVDLRASAGFTNDPAIDNPWFEDNNFLDAKDGDDVVQLPDGTDQLFLDQYAGNTFTGGNGNDTITGGSGDDIIDGGPGQDELHGGAGADTLEGGADDDVLNGDAGDDILAGGLGSDRLAGGADADSYVFKLADIGAGEDTIPAGEFVVAANDKLDVTDVLSGTSVTTDTVDFFVNLNVVGGDTDLEVDRSGGGDFTAGNPDFALLATIEGETALGLASALEDAGNLIVV
jgi:Ca2+-binding RTX toxin-like protein